MPPSKRLLPMMCRWVDSGMAWEPSVYGEVLPPSSERIPALLACSLLRFRPLQPVGAWATATGQSSELDTYVFEIAIELDRVFAALRPIPLAPVPPKGVRRSRRNQLFTQTIPTSSWSATRWARLKSSVQIAAHEPWDYRSPYESHHLHDQRAARATGPRISSRTQRAFSFSPVQRVGWTK